MCPTTATRFGGCWATYRCSRSAPASITASTRSGRTLVARFGEGAAAEARLLRAVAPLLPLPVPVPIAVDAAAGCLVLPRVPGTSLLDLPRAARRPFAAHLRAFADTVHTLDPGRGGPGG